MFWMWVGIVVLVVLLLAWRADRRRVLDRHAVDDPRAALGQAVAQTHRIRDIGGQGPTSR